MDAILTCEDLRGYYKPRFGDTVQAVDCVSFELREGEILGIAGESGCGKSTLARCIMNMYSASLKHVGGRVLFKGDDILRMSKEEFRQKILGVEISYVPQSAMNALNPMAKIKNVVWDLMRSHFPEVSYAETMERAKFRLDMLELPYRVLECYPNELSGGMKQRVVIMLSSLLNPSVLIADEPTSALDVSTQKALVKMFHQFIDEGVVKSIIFITHDLTTLRHVSSRIAVMYAGQLVEVGTVEELVFQPVHPYTEALISSILVPEKGVRDKTMISIPGTPPDLRNPKPGCRFYPRCMYREERCMEKEIELIEVNGRLVRCLKTANDYDASRVVNER
ncbi:MAG: ABC transporter ATP-binding protein [Limnochordia bacterium]|jgi:peptide/nickel transport system ATP-binding protein